VVGEDVVSTNAITQIGRVKAVAGVFIMRREVTLSPLITEIIYGPGDPVHHPAVTRCEREGAL
jgi:hypothetical protein